MSEPVEAEGIQGYLDRPETPGSETLILTHGAGSDAAAPLLAKMAAAFAANGFLVLRYNLPFRMRRPKGPPFPAQAAEDRVGVLRAAAFARNQAPGMLLAGGHSYGGRQTAMAAAEHPELFVALLLLSYPLHPPGKPEQKRTAFFPDLRTPALFVHGARDPFGSPEELREAMALISAPSDLIVVEGAGHDLRRAPDLASEILTRLHALIG
jgi:predicted alpha/beta-hydrolase family hydrolase